MEANTHYLLACKTYDHCRWKGCLTFEHIGPAYATKCPTTPLCQEKSAITPSVGADFVTMDNLRIAKIFVLHKKPNPQRDGFWDLRIRFVFQYCLTFWDDEGNEISHISAESSYTLKTSLFGGCAERGLIYTDLFKKHIDATNGPFVWACASATSLQAEIVDYQVHITLGFFVVLSLACFEDIPIKAKKFQLPEECENIRDSDPCDHFIDLKFPFKQVDWY